MSLGAVMQPASPEATALAGIIETTLWVCAGSFLVAMLVLAGALAWRGRRPVAQGWWIWGGGVGLPMVVFGGLLAWSLVHSEGLDDPPPPGALTVTVTGRMWWWDLHYGADGGAPAFATANELRVPVGRPVRLTLATGDVIHSLWVPSLNGKMDLVPGRLNRLTFTVDRPGVFRGPCAEYCGTQHAGMALQVVAMPPAEFEAWRRSQAVPLPPGALASRGARLFREQGCASCHAVRGMGPASLEGLGPDLTHVAQRQWLGAGLLRQRGGEEPGVLVARGGGRRGEHGGQHGGQHGGEQGGEQGGAPGGDTGTGRALPQGAGRDTPPDAEQGGRGAALRLWIADVQSVKPGARMPVYKHLPPEDIDALADFLETRP